MRKIIYTLFLSVVGLAAAGCNTTRGVGQDIQAAGENIEELAEETRDELND